jgi:hypothetical protein
LYHGRRTATASLLYAIATASLLYAIAYIVYIRQCAQKVMVKALWRKGEKEVSRRESRVVS